MADPHGEHRAVKWAVHRQDDNGNRYIVERGLDRERAQQIAADLEANGHKQLYWIEPDRPESHEFQPPRF